MEYWSGGVLGGLMVVGWLDLERRLWAAFRPKSRVGLTVRSRKSRYGFQPFFCSHYRTTLPGNGNRVLLARQVVALFACGVEKTGEKLFFDGGEGGGQTVRLVEPADFSFDAGRFSETREELI
jgi:hypothetical protein